MFVHHGMLSELKHQEAAQILLKTEQEAAMQQLETERQALVTEQQALDQEQSNLAPIGNGFPTPLPV